jgi:hypothetical protein
VYGLGLLCLLIGERVWTENRWFFTTLGVILVLGSTGLRAWTTFATTGARRGVERTLLTCQLAGVFALGLYVLTTNWGLGHFHFTDKGAAKFVTAVTVLYSIVLLASAVPLLMIEVTLGPAMRNRIDLKGSIGDGAVESLRVRDIGWAGLTVAFATSLLMVTCNVAGERNIQRDVSYFKTSSPGESTQSIVKSAQEPIKVLLWFPESNDVKDQVRNYFEALADEAGHLQIEEHDLMAEAALAQHFKVTTQGVVILTRGAEGKERLCNGVPCKIDVGLDLEAARRQTGKLRTFDREVNQKLLQLIHEKRKIYFTAGHGELNDPESMPSEMRGRFADRHTVVIKQYLTGQGYELKDLTLLDLSKDVPDDATFVMLLAPTQPLLPQEWAALERYVDRGGRMLMALEPRAVPSLGPFEGKFGIKFNPAPLTEDKPGNYGQLPTSPAPSKGDRRNTFTKNYSAHPSTTTLSRSGGRPLILIQSGALEDVPMTAAGEKPKKTITIKSLDDAFLDINDNLEFDDKLEKRQAWPIAAAIEGPKVKDKDGKDKDGYRALIFADAALFADLPIGQGLITIVGDRLVDDSIKWLAGDEAYVGQIVDEEDKPIEHSKSKDAKWFLLTIVGAPLAVLALGIGGTRFARRRPRKSEGARS